MSSVAPIEAMVAAAAPTDLAATGVSATAGPTGGTSGFARMLLDGVETVDSQLIKADQLTAAFAIDDSIPLHQVTFALEQARLSFDLMLTVRASLIESYQEMMRMQL